MKTNLILIIALLTSNCIIAQKDWSNVDFSSEYKRKVKIGGATGKSLKQNKTFVAGYTISQATTMKGSETSAKKAVFSEVSLGGLKDDDFQLMVDELYKAFMQELADAGLQPTEGEDVLAIPSVKSKMEKAGKNDYIGSTGDNPSYEGKRKISEGSMPGYGVWAVTRDVSFPPRNKNIYLTSNIIKSGNFYQKLATKEKYNLLIINFYITFASFDGGKGYKDIKLSTKPVLAISAKVHLVSANGASNWLTYNKLPVWGSDTWSEGLNKSKDNKNASEVLGLARSAEYEITANSNKYLNEVKSIIRNFQKDIVRGLKETM